MVAKIGGKDYLNRRSRENKKLGVFVVGISCLIVPCAGGQHEVVG